MISDMGGLELRLSLLYGVQKNVVEEQAKVQGRRSSSRRPTQAQIWKVMRDQAMSKEARYLIFRGAHVIYPVGSYWLKDSLSEDEQEQAECKLCGGTEHILTRCQYSEEEIIRRLARKLWMRKMKNDRKKWQNPGIGLNIGCGLVNFGVRKETNRFYKIVISELARLIWR
jgi:hypothetical protein